MALSRAYNAITSVLTAVMSDVEADSPVTEPILLSAETKRFLKEERECKCIMRYRMNKPIGLALLLGCESAVGKSKNDQCTLMTCVRKDLHMMREALENHKWEVRCPCLDDKSGKVSLNFRQLEDMIHDLRNDATLSQYSCFLFYYTGHGTPSGITLDGEDTVAYANIVNTIYSIPSLEGKPKIVLFDSCRKFLTEAKEPQALPSNFECKGFGEEIQEQCKIAEQPDMDVCFSACEGKLAHGIPYAGSVFTILLANALREFSDKMSFTEIMTQVKGGTKRMSLALGCPQQPICYDGLNGQLFLSTGQVSSGQYKVVYVDSLSTVSVPHVKDLEEKGQYPPKRPESPIMVDSVSPHPRKPFESRKDVEERVNELGKGINVFICYARNPHFDPQTKREEEDDWSDRLVALLSYDLEQHGFHVMSELNVVDNEPSNWRDWYVSRIHLCNFIILVCSPAFKELFSPPLLQQNRHMYDVQAKRLEIYSRAIYSEFENDVLRNQQTSKVIPVILDQRWQQEKSVPTLFDAGFVYKLFETTPREFRYNDRSRGFERLMCRMAGIDRAKLDGEMKAHVVYLPQPDGGDTTATDYSRMQFQPRQGYKQIPFTMGTQLQAAVPPTATAQRSQAFVPQPYQTTSQSTVGGQWGQQGSFPYQQQPPPGSFPYQQQPPGSFPYQQAVPSQTTGFVAQQPTYRPQYQAFQPHNISHQPQAAHPYHVPTAHPVPPTPPQQSEPDPSTLPNKVPDQRIFLWLSDKIVQWKFFARHLRLEEHEIERIEAENVGSIREQCYLMLYKWLEQRGRSCSYQSLGQALLKTKNRHRYADFVEEVQRIEG